MYLLLSLPPGPSNSDLQLSRKPFDPVMDEADQRRRLGGRLDYAGLVRAPARQPSTTASTRSTVSKARRGHRPSDRDHLLSPAAWRLRPHRHEAGHRVPTTPHRAEHGSVYVLFDQAHPGARLRRCIERIALRRPPPTRRSAPASWRGKVRRMLIVGAATSRCTQIRAHSASPSLSHVANGLAARRRRGRSPAGLALPASRIERRWRTSRRLRGRPTSSAAPAARRRRCCTRLADPDHVDLISSLPPTTCAGRRQTQTSRTLTERLRPVDDPIHITSSSADDQKPGAVDRRRRGVLATAFNAYFSGSDAARCRRSPLSAASAHAPPGRSSYRGDGFSRWSTTSMSNVLTVVGFLGGASRTPACPAASGLPRAAPSPSPIRVAPSISPVARSRNSDAQRSGSPAR